MKNSIIPQIILSSLIAAVITAGIVSAATTIGTNISTTGTLTVSGTTALNGITYTWPGSQAASTYLQTDGAGALSWAAVTSASPDWVKEINYGVLNLTASTTIPYWAKSAIYASSTLQVAGNAIFESNLGIGTSSPYAKLSVWGDGTSGAAAFEIIDNASTTLFTVLDNGSVGIGTSSPYQDLSVNGTSTMTALGLDGGAKGAPSLYFNDDTDTGIYFSGGNIAMSIGGNSRLSILSSSISVPSTVQFITDASVGYKFVTADTFAIFTANTNRITVDPSGLVGIGTTSPSQTLHVLSTTATTTVEFGDISSSTAKTCFNINATDGSASSFYFDPTNGIVFENNACK